MNSIVSILSRWKKDAGMKHEIQFTYRDGILTIYTIRQGWFMGCGGLLYDRYTAILKETLVDYKQVVFVETHYCV